MADTVYGTEFGRRTGMYSNSIFGTWELASQSIANNTSTFTLRLYFNYPGSTGSTGSDYSNIGCMGVTLKTGSYRYYPGNTFIGSTSITVAHNADGSFPETNVGFWTYSYHFNPSQETWGKINADAVPKIPRKATVTSAPDFNDEQNPTITYSNPAGTAVTELVASIYNTAGNVAYAAYRDISKTGNSYTFELTNEERQALRQACTSDSMKVRFYLRTYIGGSYLYDYAEKTMTIVNGEPTFTDFAYEDVNATTLALTGDSSKLIIGYSILKGTISDANKATANKEATMKSYTLKCGNDAKDETNISTYPVNITLPTPVTSNIIKMYATDSRDKSKIVEKTASYVNYNSLLLTSYNIARENGTAEETRLTLQGTIDEVNFGAVTNSIVSATYKYMSSASSSWSADIPITLTVNNGQFSFNSLIVGDTNTGFDIENTYTIVVNIEDKLTPLVLPLSLGSGKPNLALAKTGVAVMQKYDETLGGALQVNGDLYVDGRKHNQRQISYMYNSDIKNYNIPTAWTAVKVPLNYNNTIGDYFTWDDTNKRIVLNKDVSCLKFTACYNWYNTLLAGDRLISVRKNGAYLISLGYVNAGSNYYAEVGGEFISKATYNAGDYFELYVSPGVAGTERLFDTGNYLTIEVIE